MYYCKTVIAEKTNKKCRKTQQSNPVPFQFSNIIRPVTRIALLAINLLLIDLYFLPIATVKKRILKPYKISSLENYYSTSRELVKTASLRTELGPKYLKYLIHIYVCMLFSISLFWFFLICDKLWKHLLDLFYYFLLRFTFKSYSRTGLFLHPIAFDSIASYKTNANSITQDATILQCFFSNPMLSSSHQHH